MKAKSRCLGIPDYNLQPSDPKKPEGFGKVLFYSGAVCLFNIIMA
jgi:hypothetical protein